MKKVVNILVIIIFMIFCAGCNQCSNSTKNSNEQSSGEPITISDLDFWLQGSNSRMASVTINRLTDAYNASVVMNSLITDFDLQVQFESEHENVVKAIKNIDLTHIKDSATSLKIHDYQQEMLYLLSINPDKINQDHNSWKAKNDIYAYLAKKYYISTFGVLNEDLLLEKYNNCSSVPQWHELIKKRGNADIIAELEERYKNAKEYDARCIYAIELAHAYEANQDCWPKNEYKNPAISKMEFLMNEKQYSMYLPELWQKWRVLYQDSKGASKTSEIPNHIYNKYRELCAETILCHISEHPEDIMAINEFLVLAFKGNILREGVYQYGNQYVIDKYKLFNEEPHN